MPYILTDCSNPSNTLCVIEDLSAYVNQVITIKDATLHELSTCWLVTETVTPCVEATSIEIYKCYVDCEACLPVPTPTCPPKPRSVAPNYGTGLCDPEVAEKALCNYADMMYRNMMNHRFKLTNCCPKDDVNIFIQKEKIAFRLTGMEDPNIVPCEPTLIYNLYSLTRTPGDLETTITYFSSLGMVETIVVPECSIGGCEDVSFCAAYGSVAIDSLPVIATGEVCPNPTPCVVDPNLVYLGPCTA